MAPNTEELQDAAARFEEIRKLHPLDRWADAFGVVTGCTICRSSGPCRTLQVIDRPRGW